MKRLVECKARMRDKVTRRPPSHNPSPALSYLQVAVWHQAQQQHYEAVVDPSCVPTTRSHSSLTALSPR